MSIKIMSQVWEFSKFGGAHLLLLLKLADRANDDGVCWPGQTSLAKAARLSRRKAIDKLAEIEKSGEMRVARRGELPEKGEKKKTRDTNVYVILVACDEAEARRRINEGNKQPGITNPALLGGSDYGVTTLVTPPSLGVVTPGSQESSLESSDNPQPSRNGRKQDLLYEAVYEGVEGIPYAPRQSPHSGLASRLTKALRDAGLDNPEAVRAEYEHLRAVRLNATTSEDKLVTAIRRRVAGGGSGHSGPRTEEIDLSDLIQHPENVANE